ncbi:MAG: GNAT family N-acetyltransferase [Candidatus Limnocylindria bacterium]
MAYRPPALLEKHHRLEHFRCEEPALTDWLQRHARAAQADGSSRVYVVTLDDTDDVVGYFALAAASVAPADATPRVLKGQPAHHAVPAVLLARLARDDRHRGAGLGPALLQDALLRSIQAADVIGARALPVHAKSERARAFYMKYGFQESPTDPLHLLMLMKDVGEVISKASAIE